MSPRPKGAHGAPPPQPARLPRRAVLAGALACAVWPAGARAGRTLTDSAGRSVALPDRVTRILAAGPPASVLVYVLASDKLVGWNRTPSPAEAAFLTPAARKLPEIGRITGRGGTANLEAVLAARPDIIVDFGSATSTYVSLADRVQSQTGIPYLLIDGRFAHTVSAIRLFGEIAGVRERAEVIARYAEEVLARVDARARAAPPDKRPHVYLARGPNGLETGSLGSINTEIIERAGGVNVASAGLGQGGLYNASLEQLLSWNPDTIVTLDQRFFETARGLPGWSEVEAVRRNRVFLSPALPYGWIDAPPSINRFIGLQWLSALFFPDTEQPDLRDMTRRFYRLFYQIEVDDSAMDRLLQGTRPAP